MSSAGIVLIGVGVMLLVWLYGNPFSTANASPATSSSQGVAGPLNDGPVAPGQSVGPVGPIGG